MRTKLTIKLSQLTFLLQPLIGHAKSQLKFQVSLSAEEKVTHKKN